MKPLTWDCAIIQGRGEIHTDAEEAIPHSGFRIEIQIGRKGFSSSLSCLFFRSGKRTEAAVASA